MNGPVVLSDEEFARLRMLLSRAAGLVFDESRRESLSYSVTERLRATGLLTVSAYLDLVQQAGAAERQELLDEVTIQETHFFRNPPQVRALRSHVLPELIRTAAAGNRRLRIWSAGCSTGEEPYTIAMLLRELLPTADGWDVQVVATDLSTRALGAAREGIYGARAVQLATPEEQRRFFLARADGRFEVRPEVRELVSFRHHNLVTEPPPFAGERLELVLCRNVTIYFSRETTRQLMSRLHAALRDGGYLFLGHSETLWQVSDEFRLVALGTGDSAAYVYRRLDGGPDDRRRVLPDRRTADDGPPGEAERRTRPRRAWEAITRLGREGETPAVVPQARPAGVSAAELLEQARAALADARYVDAVALADDAAASAPLHAPAHRLRGEALVALGRDVEALVALRKALYLDPDDALAHFQLAGALTRTGSVAAAAREYRAAAEVAQRRPAGQPAPELEGRDGAEFVQLCARLAGQLSAQLEGRLAAAQERT